MVTVNDIRELFALSLTDEQIEPHLQRATFDYADIEFDFDIEEKEVIASKTLYYLAPLIWSKTSANAREFEETLETFKDMQQFQEYWIKRAEAILERYKNIDIDGDGEKEIRSGGGISWEAI